MSKPKLTFVTEEDGAASKILIIDNDEKNIELLTKLLTYDGYEVDAYETVDEAGKFLESNPPDLILSGVDLPGTSGYDLCKKVKENEDLRHTPVILMAELSSTSDRIRGIKAGADEFLTKPFNKIELLTRVRTLLRFSKLNDTLENIDHIIMAFSMAVEARDPYTRGHSERVGKYAMCLAGRLGLTENHQQMLFKGAILHDIGKIGVRDDVLLKKGRLTDCRE